MSARFAVDGAAESALERNPDIDALPGSSNEVWEKSLLGCVDKWPSTLRTFAVLLTSFPHPAAIFWGEDLVLVHNDSWKGAADGKAQQGVPQKESFPDEALSMLRTAMLGRPRSVLQAEMFMKTWAHDGVSYQALLSPIMDRDDNIASGVMVQLFQNSKQEEEKKGEQQGIFKKIQEVLSASVPQGKKSILDDLPLDENPFFQRFAALLPTGMAILNHKAEAVFVNEQFFELTSSGGQNFKAWPQSIHPEDYDRVMKAYRESFDKPGKTLRVEFRTMGEKDYWRLLMLSPLGEGRMRDESIEKYGGFVCAVIDITPNKAQELAQKKAAQEAVERKEQQERFIDMISHEIRNPLSAVLHCAEEILEVVEERKQSKEKFTEEDTSELVESAETIKLCVSHQKNIVDDILSFSKLDAAMLSLCPRSVQPKRQLADTLKMFQPEMKKQNMTLDYVVDVSIDDLQVDWVKADLVRISQILVNLVTNAIKFTAKKEGDKKITCMVGASVERPTSYPPNVVFFDTEDLGFRMDGTNSSEWGNGEALYIMVAVKDNGIGISNDDQKKLFQRFRQATPKTEENYGGSGLGLVISRKLCQLHGGEIGVSSIDGEGSTFGFFFRVRRVHTENSRPVSKDRLGSNDLMDHLHVQAHSEGHNCANTDLSDRQQITKGQAPIENIQAKDKADNLKNPKVEQTDEASAGAKGDAQFQHTAEIASHIREHSGDEYGQKSRPPVSTANSTETMGKRPTTLEMLQARTDSQSTNRSSMVSPENQRAHVLLVEDNIINQRILKRKLEAKKFRVTTANNGREAVDSVRSNLSPEDGSEVSSGSHFDVILMDQEMPVLDGNAATREIRQLEDDGEVMRVPILGVTANVREPQKDEMRSAGMDDVISKPYSMDDLIGRIDGLVQHEKEVKSEDEGWSRQLSKEADKG